MHSFSVHAHGKARACCVSKDKSKTHIEGYTDLISLKDVYNNEQNYNATTNIEDFVNDPALMKIREKMLQGKKPEECSRCWNLEDNGIKSFRQIQNTTYKDCINQELSHIDKNGKMDISSIKYLDITLGNVCNLKCRSCNPWNSHRWIEEGPHVLHTGWTDSAYKVGRLSSDAPWFARAFAEGFFDDVLPNIEAINFLGGEPLVVQEHYTWLENIIEQGYSKNISLFYNTNGTTLPLDLFKIWSQFKHVNLGLSIDAIGDLAYYVRHPTKWKVIEKNIEKLADYSKTYKNIHVQTHVTLSVLNLHDLPNLLLWCKQNYDTWHYESADSSGYWSNYGYQNCIPHFNIVENPSWLHIKHFPQEEKDKLSVMIDQQIQMVSGWRLNDWEDVFIQNLQGVNTTMNQEGDKTEWKKFIENTTSSDNYRGLNIVDYIPWMSNYMN